MLAVHVPVRADAAAAARERATAVVAASCRVHRRRRRYCLQSVPMLMPLSLAVRIYVATVAARGVH
eukprot:6190574-Pleurochrysis_carterae.AAC.6